MIILTTLWVCEMSQQINKITAADVQAFADAAVHFNMPHNTLNMYQTIATKSAIYPGKGTPFGLMYTALGLAEAGEVQNKVKKAFRDDGCIEFDCNLDTGKNVYSYNSLTPERRAEIIKEMGGNLWYLAAMCAELGTTLSEVALANLTELCGRTERGTLQGSGDDR